MQRRRLCAALLTSAVMSVCGQFGLSAQAAPVHATLDSPAFKAAASEQFWRSISALECPDTDVRSAKHGAVVDHQALVAAFHSRVGVIAPDAGGFVVSRSVIARIDGMVVEDVRVSARSRSQAMTFGYLVTPSEASRGPATVLIPATGVAATESLGWRIPGDEGIAVRTAVHPMHGAALQLARAGVTVFVPWMGEDHQYFPYLPWLGLERLGVSSSQWSGRGNTYSILLPMLSGVVDFLTREPSVDPDRIAAAGWEEGALLAGWLSVYDRRIRAVGSMSAPLDRAKMRRDPEMARYGAAFTQMDCALGDADLAALVAPRPLGFGYTTRDDAWAKIGRFATLDAEQSVRRSYASAGGREFFLNSTSESPLAARDTMVAWLSRTLGAATMRNESSVPIEMPHGLKLDHELFTQRNVGLASEVTAGRRCRSLYAADIASATDFDAAQSELRHRLAIRLRLPPLPLTAPMRLVRRDTLPGTADMRVEWIVAAGDETVNSQVLGVLATPRLREGPYPTVLSLDGYTGLSQVFGIPPVGRTAYLGAYGVELVQAGFAVFVPYVPAEFPEYAAAVATARGIKGGGSWPSMMPYYAAARSLMQTLPETRDQALTVYGISYAGVAAMLLTALDPSIDAIVYSNPVQGLTTLFSSPDGPLLAMWWTEMCDIQSVVQRYLIAPRPFVWENGALDANAYLGGVDPVGEIAHVYQARGAAGRFRFLRHGGEHETRLREWGTLVTDMLPRHGRS